MCGQPVYLMNHETHVTCVIQSYIGDLTGYTNIKSLLMKLLLFCLTKNLRHNEMTSSPRYLIGVRGGRGGGLCSPRTHQND